MIAFEESSRPARFRFRRYAEKPGPPGRCTYARVDLGTGDLWDVGPGMLGDLVDMRHAAHGDADRDLYGPKMCWCQ